MNGGMNPVPPQVGQSGFGVWVSVMGRVYPAVR